MNILRALAFGCNFIHFIHLIHLTFNKYTRKLFPDDLGAFAHAQQDKKKWPINQSFHDHQLDDHFDKKSLESCVVVCLFEEEEEMRREEK